MAPSYRDLQLTAGRNSSAGDLEDVRLLDSYDEEEANSVKVEEGMKRIQVRIGGMTCSACSNSVEGALMSLKGVLRASVALLQNKADVVFDPSLVNVSLLMILLAFCDLCVPIWFNFFVMVILMMICYVQVQINKQTKPVPATWDYIK